MSYLYVNESGALIYIEQGYFIVKHLDNSITKIPQETLDSIILAGNVSMTTPCVRECLVKGIPVSYYSQNGAYFGRLDTTKHVKIDRQRQQFHATEDKRFCLEMTKKVIEAKINNQLVVIKRYTRGLDETEKEVKQIKIAREKIESCSDIETIMGYEGIAARSYFKAISTVIHDEFRFDGRSKQPPKDPFNAMISYGYTILFHEIYGEIENRGLCPYAGFMHKDKENHAALASDLIEEWRAPIVDSVVLSLIQGNEISYDNFNMDFENGGVYMDSTARKKFINKLESKMRSEMSYLRQVSYRMSFRKAVWYQVGELVKAIEGNDTSLYNPVVIR